MDVFTDNPFKEMYNPFKELLYMQPGKINF